MKPDGIAKNGNSYWNLYRVPAKVMIYQQKSNADSYPSGSCDWKPEGERDIRLIGGIKCFEKPGKLVLMYVISNARKKRYEYKWMASITFKKSGVMLLLNKKEWGKPGKAFCNATYKTGEWDMIVGRAIQGYPMKEFAKNMPTMAMRRLAFERKLNELILWKAKKEATPVGKLNKMCARKTDFTLFRLSIGSELMSNTIYYFLKHNNVERIKFDASPVNHKKYRFFIKVLRKQKSMEKICKKIFGRNAKYIMKAVQSRLLHKSLETRTTRKEIEYTEINNTPVEIHRGPELHAAHMVRAGVPLAVMGNTQSFVTQHHVAIFDLSIFIFGYYIKDWVNLDKIQSVFSDISEASREFITSVDLMPDWLHLLNNKPSIERLLVHLGEARTERIIKQVWSMDFTPDIPQIGGLTPAIPNSIVRRIGYLRDTADQWGQKADKIVIPNNLKGLDEIHDYVSIEFRKLSSADFDLEFKDEVKAIDGVVLEGGLRLVIPKTSFQLVAWGQKMSNCIGGYGRQVNSSKGKQWLLGVYKNDMLTYNIEIEGKDIRQFWGARNSSADPKDKVTVLKFLAEKELAKERDTNRAVEELTRALEAGLYNQPNLNADNAAQVIMRELENYPMPNAVQVQDVQVNEVNGQMNINLVVRANELPVMHGIDVQIREQDLLIAEDPNLHAIDAVRYALAERLATPQGERLDMPVLGVHPNHED